MDTGALKKLDSFFKKFEKVELAPKTNLIRPNEEIKFVYYLIEGDVRQYTNTLRGEEIILHIFSAGAYFPMMNIVGDIYNTYYFDTVNRVIAYKAPAKEVMSLIKSDIEICFELAQRFAKGLSGVLIKTEHLLYQDAYYKVLSILTYMAKKFGKSIDDKVLIEIQLSHYDIASWIGIQRETASRQLEKLLEKSIIEYQNHFIVVDLEKLKLEEKEYKYYLARK